MDILQRKEEKCKIQNFGGETPKREKKTLRRAMCRSENDYEMNPGCGKHYNIRVSAFHEEVYTCAVNHETGSSNGQTDGIRGY